MGSKSYVLDDCLVFIRQGADEYVFGTYIKRPTGDIRRFKSPVMPIVSSWDEAQDNLDAWAKTRGLEPIKDRERN